MCNTLKPYSCATYFYKFSKLKILVFIFQDVICLIEVYQYKKAQARFKTELITKKITKLPPIPGLCF